MPHEIRLFLERLFAGPTLAFADESLSFRKEFTMPSSGAAEESPEDTFTLEEIVELTEALERQNPHCQTKFGSDWELRPIASADKESIPPFQQLASGDPPHGDALHSLSPLAAASRGSTVRAWHRFLPPDGAVLVEPLRTHVRC